MILLIQINVTIFDTRQDPESIKRNNDFEITLNEPID